MGEKKNFRTRMNTNMSHAFIHTFIHNYMSHIDTHTFMNVVCTIFIESTHDERIEDNTKANRINCENIKEGGGIFSVEKK